MTPKAQLAAEHFTLIEGVLYRLHTDGSMRLVTAIEHAEPAGNLPSVISCQTGRLKSMLRGQKMYGTDIAWALYYGIWPTCPVVVADGNPLNMAQDNLLAVRGTRLRPRISACPGGYKHNMSRSLYSSPELARDAWRAAVAAVYRVEQPMIIQAEARQRGLLVPFVVRSIKSRYPVAANPDKPKRPPAIEGREWHWFEGQWVSTLKPCHVSDDYILRIKATLAGAKSFVYDEEQGRVLPIF